MNTNGQELTMAKYCQKASRLVFSKSEKLELLYDAFLSESADVAVFCRNKPLIPAVDAGTELQG